MLLGWLVNAPTFSCYRLKVGTLFYQGIQL